MECTTNDCGIGCEVVADWLYSPINSTQAGIHYLSIFVNKVSVSNITQSITSIGEQVSGHLTIPEDSCGTKLLSIKADNICGFESKRSPNFIIYTEINQQIKETSADFINPDGAAKEVCKFIEYLCVLFLIHFLFIIRSTDCIHDCGFVCDIFLSLKTSPLMCVIK